MAWPRRFDERLADGGRLGALVEFGLPDAMRLVGDGGGRRASRQSRQRRFSPTVERAKADRICRDADATYMIERVPSLLRMFS